jgi:hypothetical protein
MSATSRAAGSGGQQLDHLVLDQGRVHVQHDQPLGPPLEVLALERHVDPVLPGGCDQGGPHPVEVAVQHRELEGGDRLAASRTIRSMLPPPSRSHR